MNGGNINNTMYAEEYYSLLEACSAVRTGPFLNRLGLASVTHCYLLQISRSSTVDHDSGHIDCKLIGLVKQGLTSSQSITNKTSAWSRHGLLPVTGYGGCRYIDSVSLFYRFGPICLLGLNTQCKLLRR